MGKVAVREPPPTQRNRALRNVEWIVWFVCLSVSLSYHTLELPNCDDDAVMKSELVAARFYEVVQITKKDGSLGIVLSTSTTVDQLSQYFTKFTNF